MSEYAEGSIEIEASAGDVMDVISDFEAYPEWAEVEAVEVRRRGDWGHGTEVAFVVDVPVLGPRSTRSPTCTRPGMRACRGRPRRRAAPSATSGESTC